MKFWHPLSFWKVLLIFTLSALVFQFGFAVLREVLGLKFFGGPAAGGAAALVAIMIVSALARAQRDTAKSGGPSD